MDACFKRRTETGSKGVHFLVFTGVVLLDELTRCNAVGFIPCLYVIQLSLSFANC